MASGRVREGLQEGPGGARRFAGAVAGLSFLSVSHCAHVRACVRWWARVRARTYHGYESSIEGFLACCRGQTCVLIKASGSAVAAYASFWNPALPVLGRQLCCASAAAAARSHVQLCGSWAWILTARTLPSSSIADLSYWPYSGGLEQAWRMPAWHSAYLTSDTRAPAGGDRDQAHAQASQDSTDGARKHQGESNLMNALHQLYLVAAV